METVRILTETTLRIVGLCVAGLALSTLAVCVFVACQRGARR